MPAQVNTTDTGIMPATNTDTQAPAILENIIFLLIPQFTATIEPKTTFMIYYTLLTGLIPLYHGLWLPLKYLWISRQELELS